MHDADARDLLNRARAGDRRALYDLLSEIERPLYHYCRRMARDASAAEDLIQDTWLRVLRSVSDFEPTPGATVLAAFSAWAHRIASNLATDQYRSGRRMRSLEGAAEEEDGAEFRDVLPDLGRLPPEEFERRVDAEAVRRAIEALPSEQREVVLLRIYSDIPFAEIAKIQNCPINTALGRMHYAIGALKKLLKSAAPARK
ncbi:MAG: sigma-70 family RNA polymerase sigma factor [Planctomycetes bacterium]|nr:sigma-70 family RNA polymerase sigma factor [Planctomycetota bacterium]